MFTLDEIRANCDSTPSGCWRWLGLLHKGYPAVRVNKAQAEAWGVRYRSRLRVYHMAYAQVHGPMPDGLFHLHSCDNTWCTNPDHIYPGTDKDNAKDRIQAGTQNILPNMRRP